MKLVECLTKEIDKPLPAPVHSVLQVRFKFRQKYKMLPYTRNPFIISREYIIKKDGNMTYKIVWKIIIAGKKYDKGRNPEKHQFKHSTLAMPSCLESLKVVYH